MKYYLQYLFQLILSPRNGWEDIDKAMSASGSRLTPSRIAAEGFYPLIALAAVVFFLQGIYHPGLLSFGMMFQEAIVIFVQYFLSYYFAQFVFSCFIHRYVMTDPSEKTQLYIHSFRAVAARTCLAGGKLSADIPSRAPVFAIYIAIVLWRGVRYMAVYPEKVGHFMLMSIGAILLPPFIINFLFNIIIGLPA